MGRHEALSPGDLQSGHHLEHPGLRRLHRPGPGALGLALLTVGSSVPAGQGKVGWGRRRRWQLERLAAPEFRRAPAGPSTRLPLGGKQPFVLEA